MPAKNIKADTLLVTGERGSFAAAVEKLHTLLDKSKATMLKIDRVGDVMLEAVSTQFLLRWFS
jgi:Ndr family